MMTRAYIILLFFISSSLFVHHASGAIKIPSLVGLIPSKTRWVTENPAIMRRIEKYPTKVEKSSKDRYLEYLNKVLRDLMDFNITEAKSKLEERSSIQDLQRTAIEDFQKAYDLPVTGQLNESTLELIQRPRCAVPDVVNGNYTVLNNGVIPFDWPWPKGKKNFTYGFARENNVPASLKATFSRAFSRWENVTGLLFDEMTAFNESDIRIVFLRWNQSEVVAGSDLLNSTVLSWQGMYFDVDENWVLAGGSMKDDELDIETAVMHQIGHVLGFGHTTKDQTAVMFPFLEPGTRRLNFSTVESNRIQQVLRTNPDTISSGGGGGGTTSGGGGMRPGCAWLGIALLSLAQFLNARILI